MLYLHKNKVSKNPLPAMELGFSFYKEKWLYGKNDTNQVKIEQHKILQIPIQKLSKNRTMKRKSSLLKL